MLEWLTEGFVGYIFFGIVFYLMFYRFADVILSIVTGTMPSSGEKHLGGFLGMMLSIAFSLTIGMPILLITILLVLYTVAWFIPTKDDEEVPYE